MLYLAIVDIAWGLTIIPQASELLYGIPIGENMISSIRESMQWGRVSLTYFCSLIIYKLLAMPLVL